jgi:hypothetical protein
MLREEVRNLMRCVWVRQVSPIEIHHQLIETYGYVRSAKYQKVMW